MRVTADFCSLADALTLEARERSPESVASGPGHWEASLSMAFEPRHGRTAIARQLHRGPLRIQRPFYPEKNGTCHVYLLHPPGGVVGGDGLELQVTGEAGGRALLTTPGATKLYRSLGDQARLRQTFALSGDFCLEWFPQETIAFDGSRARIQTHVNLSAEASYAGWEIVCLGRPAAEERFRHGQLQLEYRIERAGRLQWIERAEFRGGDPMLEAAWGMAGHAVIGTFVIAPGSAADVRSLAAWVDEIRAVLCQGDDAASSQNFAVTQIPSPSGSSAEPGASILILRYLGDRVHQAAALFRRAWQVIRPRYAGAAAVLPRIWHT